MRYVLITCFFLTSVGFLCYFVSVFSFSLNLAMLFAMEDMSMVFECTQFDIPIISNLTDIFCVSCTYLVYDLICFLCVDNSIVYVPCISCTAKTTLHCIVHHCVSVVLFQLNLHFFGVFC